MSDNEIERAIKQIKAVTVEDKVKSATISLINLIPYAGGAIASLITDYASQQKTNKICEVLSDLNERLEAHHAEPEKHLSKDQVVELVHQTLAYAVLSSNEAKIQALKNGLAYSFIEVDRFEAKQVFLDTLKNCTALELAVMNAVYKSSDPYIISDEPTGTPSQNVVVSSIAMNTIGGQWVAQENRSCNRPQLIEHLAHITQFDAFLIQGVAHMLDGKGLTSMVPNLAESYCKVVKWVNFSTAQVAFLYPTGEQVRPTPIEASQTDFGHNFVKFCSYS